MKKIFALIAATVVIASASFAQTDTSMHKSMHGKSMHGKSMHKSMKSGDSTTMHHSTKKPM